MPWRKDLIQVLVLTPDPKHRNKCHADKPKCVYILRFEV